MILTKSKIRDKYKFLINFIKNNKTFIIIIVILFIISLIMIHLWINDTNRLEKENEKIKLERVNLELQIKEYEKIIEDVIKEKEKIRDSIDLYKKEKEEIKKQIKKDKDKFKKDFDKIKKETLLEDQEWWNEEGKKLIKKWNLE